MICKNCGETLDGDGYSVVLHCPNASDESYQFSEPDAEPVCCSEIEDDED